MRVRVLSAAVTLGLVGCNLSSWPVPGPPVSPELPPSGSIARGSRAAAAAVAAPGPAVDDVLIARGADRYGVFCSPCHGSDGRGEGPVVRRGFPAPPSLLSAQMRQRPPSHVVEITTNGIGRMYGFAERVPPLDRWAIAHYVRTLQSREGAP